MPGVLPTHKVGLPGRRGGRGEEMASSDTEVIDPVIREAGSG